MGLGNLFGKHKASTAPVAATLPQPTSAASSSDVILDAIDDGVMLLDSQGVIQLFNPAASKITGWQTGEAVGLGYDAVIRLIDNKDVPYTPAANPIAKALAGNTGVRDNDATLITKSEKHISLSISASPLAQAMQGNTGVAVIFRDISVERQEEAQRAEFISTASHEMRTPIAAIEGYLSLVINNKAGEVAPKAQEYLGKAYDSTKHLGKLFQDLLSSSSAEDGRITSHPTVVELGSLLERVAEDVRFSAEKKQLTLELVVGAANEQLARSSEQRVIKPLYYVYADPERIREVAGNLIDNAIKYTGAGTISLGLTGNAQVVQFYVRDSGSGIPPEDLPHLFQKFYRVDSSATRTVGGTGLGLFICRKILELYNGTIWAESDLGKGSTFFVNLPRLSESQVQSMQNNSAQVVQPTAQDVIQ